ncbi:MAG: c-type cytochrome [Lysobacterales bacterium]
MKNLRVWTFPALVTCLICSLPGCDQLASSETGQSNHAGQNGTRLSWRERYLQLGHDTYQDACAECHNEGNEGAPVTGDQESWSNRSPLWSAILMVHAQDGHLGMPAKGGCAELSEHEVTAAGEYMLSVTFPELPRD